MARLAFILAFTAVAAPMVLGFAPLQTCLRTPRYTDLVHSDALLSQVVLVGTFRRNIQMFGDGSDEAYPQGQDPREEPMTAPQLLQRYGFIALAFHYMVFFITWAAIYGILSFDVIDMASLPPVLASAVAWFAGGDNAAEFEAAGKGGVSFVLLEAIGPARLALDIIATPVLARKLRRYNWVRALEEQGAGLLDSIRTLLPSDKR